MVIQRFSKALRAADASIARHSQRVASPNSPEPDRIKLEHALEMFDESFHARCRVLGYSRPSRTAPGHTTYAHSFEPYSTGPRRVRRRPRSQLVATVLNHMASVFWAQVAQPA